MATKRYVRENAAGGWDILREGDRRASVQAETQSKALTRAKAIVRAEGGGEVRVMNRMGKVVAANKVSRATARRNGKTS